MEKRAQHLHSSNILHIKVVDLKMFPLVKKNLKWGEKPLHLKEWSGFVYPKLHKKLGENVEVIIVHRGTTKYLQLLRRFMTTNLYDYKLMTTNEWTNISKLTRLNMVENIWLQGETIAKLHNLILNQISALAFEDMLPICFLKGVTTNWSINHQICNTGMFHTNSQNL